MLVVKQGECEYVGYNAGYHTLKRNSGESIEMVRQFKLVQTDGSVEVYHPDGTHSPSFATLRRRAGVN